MILPLRWDDFAIALRVALPRYAVPVCTVLGLSPHTHWHNTISDIVANFIAPTIATTHSPSSLA
jgi:hypothetical protein